MNYQCIFKRYELKYLITKKQQLLIKEAMVPFMQEDQYGQSSISNIYFDTPSYLLIRRSLESPIYKEKLRMRSYGTAQPDSRVFVELKKKYQAIVYKRRTPMTEKEAVKYLLFGSPAPGNGQIIQEINYFQQLYRPLIPAMFISYQREAFFGKADPNFRITFDEEILWRQNDLSLCVEPYGDPLLEKEQVLMELKTSGAIPLWMTRLLTENRIYKTSFSKYGNAYKTQLLKGVGCYVGSTISRTV